MVYAIGGDNEPWWGFWREWKDPVEEGRRGGLDGLPVQRGDRYVLSGDGFGIQRDILLYEWQERVCVGDRVVLRFIGK